QAHVHLAAQTSGYARLRFTDQGAHMIELHTAGTPNGQKVSIALEELGLPYRVVPRQLGTGDLKSPEYAKINPNAKIPAIVDEGVRVFESGAILIHLAEKTGKLLAPPSDWKGRAETLAW